MAGKFAGVGRATRWLALLGAMAASGGAFAAQEGGVPMPALSGAVEWLNSPPLTRESLRGKVVLVDFWTYVLTVSAVCLMSTHGQKSTPKRGWW